MQYNNIIIHAPLAIFHSFFKNNQIQHFFFLKALLIMCLKCTLRLKIDHKKEKIIIHEKLYSCC